VDTSMWKFWVKLDEVLDETPGVRSQLQIHRATRVRASSAAISRSSSLRW